MSIKNKAISELTNYSCHLKDAIIVIMYGNMKEVLIEELANVEMAIDAIKFDVLSIKDIVYVTKSYTGKDIQ